MMEAFKIFKRSSSILTNKFQPHLVRMQNIARSLIIVARMMMCTLLNWSRAQNYQAKLKLRSIHQRSTLRKPTGNSCPQRVCRQRHIVLHALRKAHLRRTKVRVQLITSHGDPRRALQFKNRKSQEILPLRMTQTWSISHVCTCPVRMAATKS